MIREITGLLFLCLIIGSVFAIQVTEISENLETNNQELTRLNAELTARISSLEQKISALPTKEDFVGNLNSALAIQQQMLDQFRNQVIISLIVCLMASLGFGFGVYFYFKSKGRL